MQKSISISLKTILKHSCIKALTLGLPWDNLEKNYIDLLLLWIYVHLQKIISITKTFLELLEFQ